MTFNVTVRLGSIIRVLILSIIVLLGVVSGILIGYQLVSRKQALAISANVSGQSGISENMKLRFGVGDYFPDLQLDTMKTDNQNARNYFIGKRSAIIFSEVGCEPCQRFFEQWNQIVTPKLKPNVQVVVVISKEEYSLVGNQLPEVLRDMNIHIVDLDEFKKTYNLVIFPTVVTVDEEGIVRHIQYGLRGGIDYEILKFLTTHDI